MLSKGNVVVWSRGGGASSSQVRLIIYFFSVDEFY
jgi:hypothetical protein